MLLRFSSRSEDLLRAVAELRWFHTEGRIRGILQDLPEGFSEELLAKKDEDIIKALKAIPPTGTNLAGTDIPLPILDGILSAQVSFLSTDEIKSLSDLRWQANLLASEARSMELWLGMTFTVTDSDNHEIVVQNRRRCERGYRVRLGYTLDHLLEALRTLNRPGRIKTLFSAKKCLSSLWITRPRTWIK